MNAKDLRVVKNLFGHIPSMFLDDTIPTQGGVNPDWNQNDPSKPDFIKNRICSSEIKGREYHNQSEGYSVVTIFEQEFEHYDAIPLEDFVGRTLTVTYTEDRRGEVTLEFSTDNYATESEGFYYVDAFLVLCTQSSIEGISTGLYFLRNYSSKGVESPVSYTLSEQEQIKKIDKKFLPSTAMEVVEVTDPEIVPEAITPNKFYYGFIPSGSGLGGFPILVDFSSLKSGECCTSSGVFNCNSNSSLNFGFTSIDSLPIDATTNLSEFAAHTIYTFTIQMFKSTLGGYGLTATFTACGTAM